MGSRRRRRRQAGRAARGRAAPPPPLRFVRRWRRRIDSFGGLLTIVAVVAGIALLAFFVVRNGPFSISDDPLLGEAVQLGPATHVTNVSELQITPGQPPAGGPMFPQTTRQGVYDNPIPDGNAIHSLEHGLVWISYSPDLVDDATVSALEDIAGDFRRDVIVSPRPDNAMPIAAVSWGRILRLDEIDAEQIRAFVSTNRNRSPEPGIR